MKIFLQVILLIFISFQSFGQSFVVTKEANEYYKENKVVDPSIGIGEITDDGFYRTTDGLYIDDITAIETTGIMAFTVTLIGTVQGGFTVDYNTSDVTALDGSDYTASTGILTFAGTDQENVTFAVPILDDVIIETTETYNVNLSALSTTLTQIVDGNGNGTILDNDYNPGVSGISIDDVAVNEDVGILTFTVILDGAIQGGFTIDYVTSDSTALEGSDYTYTTGTLVFAGLDGETQTFSVPILDDLIIEPSEDLHVTLSNLSTTLTGIVDGDGLGTIIDNDYTAGVSGISVDDVTVDEDAGILTFAVILDGAVQGGFAVDYVTSDNTAIDGSDYTSTTGTLTFVGNHLETQTFSVPILDDAIIEPTEDFNATLSNLSTTLTQILDGDGVGTIIDDDFDPGTDGLVISDETEPEDIASGLMTFTVTLTGAVQGGFTVDYVTSDNTAISGTDYTFTSGILVFDGVNGEIQTFDVPILDDIIIEPTEDFNATLSNISTSLADIVDGDGVGTIIDNDTTGSGGLFTVTKEADVSYVEIAGEVITFTITIENPGSEPVSNLILADSLVSDLSFVTGDINSNNILDLEEVWIFTATYTVTQEALDGFGIDEYGNIDGDGDIDNIVSVNGDFPDGSSHFDIAHEDVEITLPPSDEYFLVSKLGDPVTVSVAGDVITYTITVASTGYVAVNNVVVTDPLVTDLQLTSGDYNGNGILDVMETWIYAATHTVSQYDIDNNGIDEYGIGDGDGDIDNVVWVDGTNPAGNPTGTDTAHEDIEIETVGVDEVKELLFAFYPNPVKDLLQIELTDNDSQIKLTISNLQGQLVFVKELQPQTNGLTVNVSNLSTGMYYLKVEADIGSQIQKLIIK